MAKYYLTENEEYVEVVELQPCNQYGVYDKKLGIYYRINEIPKYWKEIETPTSKKQKSLLDKIKSTLTKY